MILPMLMLAVQADTPAPADRFAACVMQARADPVAGERDAALWVSSGGGYRARQCDGVALAGQRRWSAAAIAFEDAARGATAAKDAGAADSWVQAGDAWLAAGEPDKAKTALDAALAAGTLADMALGEARLDRARALYALRQPVAARTDLDAALTAVPDDGLAWLLSATLARESNDLPRAHHDIAGALERAPDAADVQVEAGNIAAQSGDADGAKAAWREAARLDGSGPAGAHAAAALAQFDGRSTPPPASAPAPLATPAPSPAGR